MHTTLLCLWLALVPSMPSPSFMFRNAAPDAEAQKDDLYREARKDLDAGRFNAAADKFGRSAQRRGKDADAALYWKAYAERKGGKTTEALATLRQLAGGHPKSAWLDDARALELEIRGAAGQRPNPAAEEDEELKLYALNGLVAAAQGAGAVHPLPERLARGAQDPPRDRPRRPPSGAPEKSDPVAGGIGGRSSHRRPGGGLPLLEHGGEAGRARRLHVGQRP